MITTCVWGAPLKSHLFIQIYRELRGTQGALLHLPRPREEQEAISTWVASWEVEGCR